MIKAVKNSVLIRSERQVTFSKSTAFFFLYLMLATGHIRAQEIEGCIDGGKLLNLQSKNVFDDTITASRDQTFLILSNYNADFFQLFDLKTRKIKRIAKPSGTGATLLEGDEVAFTTINGPGISNRRDAILTIQKATTTIIDPKTGLRRQVTGKIAIGDSLFSADSFIEPSTLILKNKDNFVRKLQINDNSDTALRYTEKLSEPEVSHSQKTNILQIKVGEKVLYSGKMELAQPRSIPGGFTPDGRKFITQSSVRNPDGISESRLVVIDLEKKSQKSYRLPPGYTGADFSSMDTQRRISKNSQTLVLHSISAENDSLKIFDIGTGQVTSVAKITSLEPYFDPSGYICAPTFPKADRKWETTCFDPKTYKEISKITLPTDLSSISPLSSNEFIIKTLGYGQNPQVYYYAHQKVCPSFVPTVDCDCLVHKGKSDTKNIDLVNDIALKLSCAKNFAPAEWKQLTPDGLSTLDEKTSLIFLKRFSKPGGFDAEKHTGYLLGMLKAGIQNKYPADFKAALEGVIYSSDRLFDTIREKYPELGELQGIADGSCKTPAEKLLISQAVGDYAKSRILALQRPKITELKPIANIAKDSLTTKEKESLAELAADKLVFTAADSAEVNQVFSSKTYLFAKNKMKESLGLGFKNLTDLTVVRDAENLLIYQLGVQGFDGSTETAAGFHIKRVSVIPISSLPPNRSTQTYKWEYEGKQYSAEVGLNKKKLDRELISSGPAPDYNKMWKQKEFRGLIITGSNLGKGLTENVMREYVRYFTQQGFEFGKPTQSNNIPQYLEDAITGPNPIHYFVKEAHSDGDEKNLFRVQKNGIILSGTRKVGDKTEKVDLISPAEKMESVLLSNQDFGRWIKTRETDGKPQLVYLNSSCWSKAKAIFEITAAASSTLINIPTTTSMVTFLNNDKNVMYAAIDGIRNKKSYAEIRESMKKDSKYESKVSNVFIFPDQDEYKNQITDVLRIPVDVNPKLFVKQHDGTLAPYSIEEKH